MENEPPYRYFPRLRGSRTPPSHGFAVTAPRKRGEKSGFAAGRAKRRVGIYSVFPKKGGTGLKRILAALLLMAALTGCAGETGGVRPPEENSRLTVYTCLEEAVYAPLVQEFEARTGIWTEVRTGTAPELLSGCGDGHCDVLWGCEADLLGSADGDFLPIPPGTGSLDPMCPSSDTFTSVSLGSLVLIFNSRLIRQNLPTGLNSLLDEAWRGQIAFADPETTGFSRTALAVLRAELGEDSVSRFAGNLSTLLPDTRAVIEGVAEGSFCLALAPEDAALRAVADGASVTVVYPREGVYRIAQTAALPAAAPHPQNGARFLAFLQGEDAQRYSLEKSFLDPAAESMAREVERGVYFDAAAAGQAQAALMELWRGVWEDGQ